jgi:hypothetical protein
MMGREASFCKIEIKQASYHLVFTYHRMNQNGLYSIKKMNDINTTSTRHTYLPEESSMTDAA